MPVVTMSGVEILRVGNWHSGLSGRVAMTGDDIDAMVLAAADRDVDSVPLRFGHVDPRFDGEPAAGWLTNVRRHGDTLVADVTDVPASLAETIRSGFKRRSAEIAWGVKTPAGKTYRASLAGLALLGVTPPAVKGLADVVGRYSALSGTTVSSITTFSAGDSDTDTFVPYGGGPNLEDAVTGAKATEADWDAFLDESMPGMRPRRHRSDLQH